jgi:hypothetical protein
MTGKETLSRNSYAAFRTVFRISNCFQRTMKKIYNYFSYTRQPENLKTICVCKDSSDSICAIGLIKNYLSGDPVPFRFLSQKTGPSLVVFLLVVGALSLDDIRGDQRGWPLMTTVKNEATGDSRNTYDSCHSLVGSLGSLCWSKIFLFSFGCSSQPSTKHYFLTVHYFTSFLPTAQQAGQAVVPRRLSLNICLL